MNHTKIDPMDETTRIRERLRALALECDDKRRKLRRMSRHLRRSPSRYRTEHMWDEAAELEKFIELLYSIARMGDTKVELVPPTLPPRATSGTYASIGGAYQRLLECQLPHDMRARLERGYERLCDAIGKAPGRRRRLRLGVNHHTHMSLDVPAAEPA